MSSPIRPDTELMAYAGETSVVAGGRVPLKVSCRGAEEWRLDVVRLHAPTTAPAPPGFRESPVASSAAGDYPARWQPIDIGSCAVLPAPVRGLEAFSVSAFVWPTRLAAGRQAILSAWRDDREAGWSLEIDEGRPTLRIGNGGESVALTADGVLAERTWYFLAATFDGATGAMALYVRRLEGHRVQPGPGRADATATATVRPTPAADEMLVAAWRGEGDRRGGFFDGKIERPRLAGRALDAEGLTALAAPRVPAGLADALIGAWDFSAEIPTDRVVDLGPNRLDGFVYNLPMRAATGVDWDGSVWDWRLDPAHYGAIHFHSDDIYDAGWQTDVTIPVPADWPSGVYAARLTAGDAEWYVPFVVRPAPGAAADTVFLLPTATYMAYANIRVRIVSPYTDRLIGRLTVVDPTDLMMFDQPLGRSTYDTHADGSAVHYSSMRRPVTNFRPTESDLGMAYNNFACDLLVIDWLEQHGPFDVLTDEDLDADGLAALAGARVVVTGAHPEYYSKPMLDALAAFTRRGGRLMYLGGNGFYWHVVFRRDKPGAIELRRARQNIARWNPGPGQDHHSFNGAHGGLWRDLGRAPQAISGVGFVSQGFDRGEPYRRRPAAADPRAAFIFEGVEGDVFGDFGVMLGGAAGVEIDAVDPRRGTPPHALVVASSSGHTNVYEESEELFPNDPLDPEAPDPVRADMVFFEVPGGGAVFSVGSIGYAGSLAHAGYDNPIARLTGNVLARFRDPTPFKMPPTDAV
ncbi:LamG domain-containing protein [Acuticoccus mangrovi]|uniref:LamG domain-containing protein n=1 Tax=Acuticoccus mangrovi TaxID=2796142 RepID=A0A934MHA9_9HYPH|nr:LamG domain-containing protein [Acuticoccus mangrovi]MBJ3776755.1 LamG domain-containing protein [Acuticoccus mangrovi]